VYVSINLLVVREVAILGGFFTSMEREERDTGLGYWFWRDDTPDGLSAFDCWRLVTSWGTGGREKSSIIHLSRVFFLETCLEI